MKTAEEETEEFVRARMLEDLAKCTDIQQQRFHCIFSGGVPTKQLHSAWSLIKRTLQRNEEKAEKTNVDGR